MCFTSPSILGLFNSACILYSAGVGNSLVHYIVLVLGTFM